MTARNDLLPLSRAIAAQQRVSIRTVTKILNMAWASIKHRALVEQGQFFIPHFGVFSSRFVNHGKVVNGNVARPQLVLRFKPSKASRALLVEQEEMDEALLHESEAVESRRRK